MSERKPVLAVETSSDLCSAAVITDGGGDYTLSIRGKHVHSEKLIPMIETVLSYAGLGVRDLGHIAVSMGPGSFTGLRIGLSAVKGMAEGSGVPICPVPTFDAFALSIVKFLTEGKEFAIARNVNVEEIYAARYRKTVEGYEIAQGIEIIKKENFASFIKQGDSLFGNFKFNNSVPAITDVDALAVAEWSVKYGEALITKDYDYLEPDYLKKFEGRKSK